MHYKKAPRALVVLFLLSGVFFTPILISCNSTSSIQTSHIEANVPEAKNFDSFLRRDLKLYFDNTMKTQFHIDYELLREGPTQSGVAYPKFYLWVRIHDGKKVQEEGAVRIAAVEKTHFEVTNYVTKEHLKLDSRNIYEIFPKPVGQKIETIIK